MSKSRGEKGNKTPNNNQNNQPTHQNAIVPGKFLECDWIDLVENESCEEFISEIVNETVVAACDIVFQNIIQQRVQPYSVFCAKELILDLIELQFLQYDKGQEDISCDESWIEDDEPNACITDSWAQGAVPVLMKTIISQQPTPAAAAAAAAAEENVCGKHVDAPCKEEHTPTPSPSSPQIKVSDRSCEMEQEKQEAENDETTDQSKEINAESNLVLTPPPVLAPTPPPVDKVSTEKSNVVRRKGYKPHTGSLPKFSRISLTPVTDDRPKLGVVKSDNHTAPLYSSNSFLKNQHGRPPGMTKDVTYDENGNVVRVQKINVASLPKHRIRTKFSIIDPLKEANQKARLKTTYVKKVPTNEEAKQSKDVSIIHNTSLLKQYCTIDGVDQLENLRTPLPPPMVDVVELAEGVVIKEGSLSKGELTHKNTDDIICRKENPLHPIPAGTIRKLEIKDIIANASPTIKNTFSLSKPLPAIPM